MKSRIGTPGKASVKTRTKPKFSRSETLDQALHWDKAKSRYLKVGYCHSCAGQHAWGHQVGFGKVRPPCGECVT